MEKTRSGTYGRLPYRDLDVMPIPVDVPGLGIQAGERGQIQAIELRCGGSEVVAHVRIPYSTGQTKCLLEVCVRPEAGVISTTA